MKKNNFKLSKTWREDMTLLLVLAFFVGIGLMVGFIIGCVFELNNVGTYMQYDSIKSFYAK